VPRRGRSAASRRTDDYSEEESRGEAERGGLARIEYEHSTGCGAAEHRGDGG
jgi:hypothetical protein